MPETHINPEETSTTSAAKNKFKAALQWLNANKIPLLTGAVLATATVVGAVLLNSADNDMEELTEDQLLELEGAEVVDGVIVIEEPVVTVKK